MEHDITFHTATWRFTPTNTRSQNSFASTQRHKAHRVCIMMKDTRHTFSLSAFQSLLSRQAGKVTEYLSQPKSLPAVPHHDTPPTIYTAFHIVEGSRRSIAAESDCSDDHDLHDDEGWIPISWETCDVSPSVPTTSYSSTSSEQFKAGQHKRAHSFTSNASSIFSEVTQEWTPPSTPGSSAFGETGSKTRMMRKGDEKEDEVWKEAARSMEETMKWIFEYDNRGMPDE